MVVMIAISLLYYKKRIDPIGITGNALPADIAEFITSGADTVIIKPLTKSKLVECINAFKSKL